MTAPSASFSSAALNSRTRTCRCDIIRASACSATRLVNVGCRHCVGDEHDAHHRPAVSLRGPRCRPCSLRTKTQDAAPGDAEAQGTREAASQARRTAETRGPRAQARTNDAYSYTGSDGAASETRLVTNGTRQRVELGQKSVVITQCDTRQILQVSDEAKVYVALPIERRRRPRPRRRKRPASWRTRRRLLTPAKRRTCSGSARAASRPP